MVFHQAEDASRGMCKCVPACVGVGVRLCMHVPARALPRRGCTFTAELTSCCTTPCCLLPEANSKKAKSQGCSTMQEVCGRSDGCEVTLEITEEKKTKGAKSACCSTTRLVTFGASQAGTIGGAGIVLFSSSCSIKDPAIGEGGGNSKTVQGQGRGNSRCLLCMRLDIVVCIPCV